MLEKDGGKNMALSGSIDNAFADDVVTESRRMIPLARDGQRPTLVQYLAELPGYKVVEDRLLRPDRTIAAVYENGGTNRWLPYADPVEMVNYTNETSRSQRG